MPIIVNADYNGIIYSHIISGTTRRNLYNINKILGKIFKTNLFNSNIDPHLTPFNSYLLEILPTFNDFYNFLTSVKLSEKIETLVNIGTQSFMEKIKTNLYFYFENNAEQIYNMQYTCFSIDQLFIISETIVKNKDKFKLELNKESSVGSKSNDNIKNQIMFNLEKNNKEKYSFFNFSSACQSIYEFLKRNKMKFTNKNLRDKTYYLHYFQTKNPIFSETLFNKRIKYTLSENESLAKENILSKVKYCIKTILKNINLINPIVYSSLAGADDTKKFFMGLEKIIDLEDNSISIDAIPLNWYSMYMTNYFEILSKEYTENDYNLLYEELFKEANKEVENLKKISNIFNSKLGMNLRCSEKIVENVKRESSRLKNIENYIKIERFMEMAKIKVCIRKNSNRDSNSQPAIEIQDMETCVHQKMYYVNRLLIGKKTKKNSIHIHDQSINSCSKIYNKNSNNVNEMKNSNKSVFSLNDNQHFNSSKSVSSNYHFYEIYGNNPSIYKSLNIYKEEYDEVTNKDMIECHCENIFEFIREFQKFPEIKEDIDKGESENQIGVTLESYLNFVFKALEENVLFSNNDNEGKKAILQDIENYILRKMYKNVFPEKELDDDIKFYEKCKTYNFLQPIHFDIDKRITNKVLWEGGIRVLSRLDFEKSPLDKLNCVDSVLKIINNSINFCLCENDKKTGADNQNGILMYMILKANLKRFVSNVNYIKAFLHGGNQTNQFGYIIAQLESTVEYILKNLNLDNLSNNQEEKNM